MLKRSKQRESIKKFLISRYDHPTAETVYMNIKEEFPNISLGTVYRNLSLLADIGEIQKLSTGIGPDRFAFKANHSLWRIIESLDFVALSIDTLVKILSSQRRLV